MKKIVITLILVLIAVYLVLSLFSSSYEYNAERALYRAIKLNEKIAINPDVAPPAMVAAVESALNGLLEKYSNAEAAKAARLALAEFYIQNKKYDAALKTIDSILASKNSNKGMLSSAQFMKGVLYEKQDKWDKALKEYIKLRDTYKDTPIGLQIPIYIARHYSEKGQDEARKAYNEAAQYYEKLATEYKGSPLGYQATNFLISIYFGMKDFAKAGDAMEKAMEIYPVQLTMSQHMPYVEFIFVKQLNKPDRAIRIYNTVIKKINDPKIKKALQDRIDELSKVKK